MTKRLGYALVCAVVASTFGLSACSDDDSTSSDGTAGSSAGTKTGGSSAGGSSNKAGMNSGGTSSAGTGTAGASEGGAGGEGGAPVGGAGGEGGAVSNAGAAGSGAGAGGTGELTYACGDDTLPKKLCSAFVAADCTDPTVCADCVTERTAEREDFYDAETCATCRGKFDAYFQCVVDAFEGDNISQGVECIEDYGADIHFENCVPLLDEASACHTYLNQNACPATWPPT